MSLYNILSSLGIIICISITVLFILYDLIPFIKPIIKRKFFKVDHDKREIEELESLILKASLTALKGSRMLMLWKEPKSISEKVFSFLFIKKNENIEFYNFPRAFLYYGLIEYLIKTNNKLDLEVFKKEFDKIIDERGKPKFIFEKVDQAMFGTTALRLYDFYKEEKYINFANYVYSFIKDIYDSNNGLVFYRKDSSVWYYDTLGMVLPFLVCYCKNSGNNKSILIAKEQMALYIKLGMDKETYIPSHGVNLKTNLKVGSINWGRGLGWYLIGLQSLYNFDESFSEEYKGISNAILKLKNENGLWSQFPGSSYEFDASTSTMLLSCLPLEYINTEMILRKFDKFISKDGFILQTSGDTYGANRYSESFGKSELSQGMLLLTLSRFTK